MQAQGQLFARHLGGQHPQRQVCQLILGVIPGTFGQLGGQPVPQVFHAISPLGRDHEGLGEGIGRVHLLSQGQQGFRLDAVDLVDGQRHRAAHRHLFFHPVEDRLHALGQATMRLDQQHDDIGIRRPAPGRLDHRPIQTPARTEQAGRVHEYDLRLSSHADTADPGPGSLHLVGDDRDLGPDHPVQQRGLAGIGFADQRHKPGAGGLGLSHPVPPTGPEAPGLPPVRRRVSCWRRPARSRHWPAAPRR